MLVQGRSDFVLTAFIKLLIKPQSRKAINVHGMLQQVTLSFKTLDIKLVL